jgi:4-hydroxybenzoate polyprenyltransferase
MFLKRFSNYLSLIKFSHTEFALPFAVIGYFLAVSRPEYSSGYLLFILVILCMFLARSAAMAFNRYIDRDIDKKNPRTRSREIPGGIIKPGSALFFVIICGVLFIVTTWFINRLCFYLSPVALAVILGYSYTKRFTAFSHFILGLGLSLSPIGAYLAVTGKFELLPLIYSGLVFFWVGGFDIIYSLQDEDFDKKEKLRSIPSVIGKRGSLLVSIFSHSVSLGFLYLAGYLEHGGLFFWLGALIFTVLLIYQHTLVKPRDISKVNMAFAITNGYASILLAIFSVLDLYWRMDIF